MDKKLINEKALILFSGGQDSTTCLIWALKTFKKVIALSFDYQQKHSFELQQGKIICKKLNVERIVVNASFINKITENALTRKKIKIEQKKGELPSTFVAGRNLFFLSIAGAIAYQKDIKNIVTGVCQTDFSGYPDCRDEFIKSLNQTLNLAIEYKFKIYTPLMWLTKAQSIKLLQKVNNNDISILADTHTCYDPKINLPCQKGKDINTDLAYLAGVNDSDGYMQWDKKKGNYSFELNTIDEDFVDKTKRKLFDFTKKEPRKKIYPPFKYSKIQSSTIYNISLFSKKLLLPLYKFKKEELLEAKMSSIVSYIGGFFDGDGSIDKSDGRIKISNTNIKLLKFLSQLLSKLEINTKIYLSCKAGSKHGTWYHKKDVYDLVIPAKYLKVFIQYIRITIKRKRIIGKEILKKRKRSLFEYKIFGCGICPACKLRLKGFKEVGIKDPIKYK